MSIGKSGGQIGLKMRFFAQFCYPNYSLYNATKSWGRQKKLYKQLGEYLIDRH